MQKRTEDSLPTSFFVQRESLFVDDTGPATLHKSINTATDAMDHGPGTSIHNRSSGRCRPATAGGRPGQGRGRRKRQKSTSEDPRLLRAGLVLCMNHPSSRQAGAARHRHPPWRPMSAPYVKRVDRWKQFTAAGVSEQVLYKYWVALLTRVQERILQPGEPRLRWIKQYRLLANVPAHTNTN